MLVHSFIKADFIIFGIEAYGKAPLIQCVS